MMRDLVEMGVPRTLTEAANIIEEYGLHRGSTVHQASGAVDVWGAIALACGAKKEELSDHLSLSFEFIPQANIGRALATYDYLSLRVGVDACHWSDSVDSRIVVKALRHLAYESNFSSLGDDDESFLSASPTDN